MVRQSEHQDLKEKKEIAMQMYCTFFYSTNNSWMQWGDDTEQKCNIILWTECRILLCIVWPQKECNKNQNDHFVKMSFFFLKNKTKKYRY